MMYLHFYKFAKLYLNENGFIPPNDYQSPALSMSPIPQYEYIDISPNFGSFFGWSTPRMKLYVCVCCQWGGVETWYIELYVISSTVGNFNLSDLTLLEKAVFDQPYHSLYCYMDCLI